MCRHIGYTPEQEEHRQRWHAEQQNEQAGESYYAIAYVQPALTAGLPLIVRNEDGHNILVDAVH